MSLETLNCALNFSLSERGIFGIHEEAFCQHLLNRTDVSSWTSYGKNVANEKIIASLLVPHFLDDFKK